MTAIFLIEIDLWSEDFYSESRLYSFKDSIKVFALIKTDFVKV